MSKTSQKELLLQSDMKKSLEKQKFFVTKTSERFKAGRPDLRIARADLGQLDVELKYCVLEEEKLKAEFDSGMTKLQWLIMRQMNEHGAPAVCLIYFEALDTFAVTSLLRCTLPQPRHWITKLPKPDIVSGVAILTVGMEYLRDAGYHKRRRA